MPTYIALLRGVNVGGHRKVSMAELKTTLEGLGYGHVRTLIASGNLVLDASAATPAALEQQLEVDLARALDLRTDVLVRDPDEWDAIVAANPLPQQAESDPSHLLVTLFKQAPSAAALDALLAAHQGPEVVRVHDRQAYVYYPQGAGQSKLNLGKLGVGTARNWNTMLKLRAMVRS